jgi:iron(II)-dependent oxidoreductase
MILSSATLSRPGPDAGLTDLDDPTLVMQHDPLMSPLVWDLAHVGQQEELWLLRAGRPGARPGRLPPDLPQDRCVL